MDRDGVEVHKLARNEQGQYLAILTARARSANDLLYGLWGVCFFFFFFFFFGAQRVVLSGQESDILAAWVANHSTRFGSSCLPAIYSRSGHRLNGHPL